MIHMIQPIVVFARKTYLNLQNSDNIMPEQNREWMILGFAKFPRNQIGQIYIGGLYFQVQLLAGQYLRTAHFQMHQVQDQP